MPSYAAYLGCGSTGNAATSYPCVLYRPTPGAAWTKIHQSPTQAVSFSGIHGLADGSFIVAVGGMAIRDSYRSNVAALSYYKESVGAWQSVTTGLPASPAMFTCVFVADSDTVYIGGTDGEFASGGRGYLWKWTPSTNTFNVEIDMGKSGGSALKACPSVHGTGPNNVWASEYNGGCDCNGRIWTWNGGPSWIYTGQPPEGGYSVSSTPMLYAVSNSDVFANAVSGSSTSPGYRGSYGRWDGATWTWTIPTPTSGQSSHAAVATGAWAVLTSYQSSAVRTYKVVGAVMTEKFTFTSQGKSCALALTPDETQILWAGTDNNYGGDAHRAFIRESFDSGENWGSLTHLQDDLLAGYHFVASAWFGLPVFAADPNPSFELVG